MKHKKIRKRLRRALWQAKDFVWGGYRRGGLYGLYHWIRCHVWNRYHIVNISRVEGTGKERWAYDWGWIDRDEAMFLACFALLAEFVELEDPSVGLRSVEDFGPESEDERQFIERQVEREREVRAIYGWWKKDYPEKMSVIAKVGRGWYEQKEALYKEEDEMLIRLMKVRLCLWT